MKEIRDKNRVTLLAENSGDQEYLYETPFARLREKYSIPTEIELALDYNQEGIKKTIHIYDSDGSGVASVKREP